MKKREEKYLTENKFKIFEKSFEGNMRSIAKSFADNAEVMALILEEIRTIHEDNKYFRESISNLYGDVSRHDRKIGNLDIRVEKIESK
ncbi:hypothetical protein A3B85_00860 [Candidatus Nomurabacteria bacterium RIFCSPHIGHO2_02_FULL_37_13]|uniref:Uncharacterized protein n=1 Tax=Candidatus Nomurabacteria bacterium RIFCSPHIGHO2_02_FULL_37_13 TaxID=1801750 RepID=A0A1F6W6H9_9BACT|nr:MAG: hypothetical protein A3B85_00860 [Candidatus Nomurabacteria bacterium RIFCSPHIGHO2_02_FULL_37_13]